MKNYLLQPDTIHTFDAIDNAWQELSKLTRTDSHS